MNKQELVDAIAEQSKQSKTSVHAMVDALVVVVREQLSRGEDVSVHGLGTFTTVQRQERSVRNPRTGEMTTAAAKTAAKFRPAAALKNALN